MYNDVFYIYIDKLAVSLKCNTLTKIKQKNLSKLSFLLLICKQLTK
ncbi:hypothetical protein TOREUM_40148 [Tenacibaculum litoreum]